MLKILIAEPTHQSLQNNLTDRGFYCTNSPQDTIESLSEVIEDFEGLVIRSKFLIDKKFIDKAKNLKFIARAGSGMENIDTEYANKKNIVCINSPEGNRDSVGEHTLGMLLSLAHKLNIADKEVRKGIWDRQSNIGTELYGKTIGILGYGNMGSAFAQRLKGFSTKVIAYDKYKFNFSNEYVKEVNLSDFFKETEILSIHLPLTDETKFMIDHNFIQQFSEDLIIINTARGKVLRTDDLVKNLKSKKVKAAALDVLEYEKSSFENIYSAKNSDSLNFLIETENVILTPHVAGSSIDSYRKIAEVLSEKIINIFSK